MRKYTNAKHRALFLETLEVRRVLENHAPVLDTGTKPDLNFSYENNDFSTAGTRVGDFASSRINDGDAGALEGIAIVGLTERWAGGWLYSTNGGDTWRTISTGLADDPLNGNAPTDTTALVLGANDYVRFEGASSYIGIPQLKFRAWDQTDGTARGTIVDTTGEQGGAGAYSTAFLSAQAILYDAPKIVASGTLGYKRGDPAMAIAPNAKVGTFGRYDLGGRTLGVRTEFPDQGALAIGGAFTVDASNQVKLNGVVVGSRTSDGLNGRPLLVKLSQDVTQPVVQQLVRSITYFAESPAPFGNRQVELTLNTSQGFDYPFNSFYAGLRTVKVSDYGVMQPVVTMSGMTQYQRGEPPVKIAPEATLTNTDITNWKNGTLTVTASPSGTSQKLWFTAPFQLSASAENVISIDDPGGAGRRIGQIVSNGIGTNPLKFKFFDRVTRSDVERLLQSITYENPNGTAGQRTITFKLVDGDASATASKTVNVT